MKKAISRINAPLMILLAAAVIISCNFKKKGSTSSEENNSIIKDSIRYRTSIFQEVDIEKDIRFAEVTNYKDSLQNLLLDVYTPSGDSVSNRPAILWVHGGGFSSGDKTQKYIVTLANAFAKKGYVCISTDYRLRKRPKEDMAGTIGDAVSDVMKALEWIRLNSTKYGINKNYIAVGGGSAGGILSTNLCYKDSTEKYKWDKSGIFAFVNLWGSPGIDRFYGAIDKNDPPTILIHGKADSIVPYSNSEWLAAELTKAGVLHTLYPIEGAGHTPVEFMDDIIEQAGGFLFKVLSGDSGK